MRKFRKNSAKAAAFLMAVTVALSSTPSAALAAAEPTVQEASTVNTADQSQTTQAEEATDAVETEATEEEATDAAETEATEEEATDTVQAQATTEAATEATTQAAAETTPAAQDVYVLMNVPFNEFYEADLNNDVAVDTFTSATKTKTTQKRFVGNTYHNADGSEITGVAFPVKVSDASVLANYTKVDSEDALYSASSYSYYVLSETPSMYKELTVSDGKASFGALVNNGETTVLDSVTATLGTNDTHGDYILSLDGIKNAVNGEHIYSVVVSTEENHDYAMRPLENSFYVKGELGWTSTDNTTDVKGSAPKKAHYVSLMGETINKITYYTSDGTYVVNTSLKVPVKVEPAKYNVKVGGVTTASKEIAVRQKLPADFDATYTVDGLGIENAKLDGNSLEIGKDSIKAGSYTLTVSDASGKYADILVSLTVTTATAVAQYNEDSIDPAIKALDGKDADDLSAYIKNITSVEVDGKAYTATGKGKVTIVNSDGTINKAAKSGQASVFTYGEQSEVTIKAAGYPDLTFSMTPEQRVTYVYMNIPYDKFYEKELIEGSESVDAVTSATLQKSRTKSMTGNAYHTDATGKTVAGVTFPVKIVGDIGEGKDVDLSAYKKVTDDDSVTITTTLRGVEQTNTYTGKDSLYENESYSYYVIGEADKLEESQIPNMYKTLTVEKDGSFSFSEAEGEAIENTNPLENVEASLSTESHHADYSLALSGDALSAIKANDIYAVMMLTMDSDGLHTYAMRPNENVWRGTVEIGWSNANADGTDSKYKALMGQDIIGLCYYTASGAYTITVDDVYVPVKLDDASSKVTVSNVAQGSTTASIIADLPEDFEASYSIEGVGDATVQNGTLTCDKLAEQNPGSYTLVVKDTSGVYADISATFKVTTKKAVAQYNGNGDAPAITKTEAAKDNDLTNYISKIATVEVDGVSYAATGRNAVKIVKEDGTIDTTSKAFTTDDNKNKTSHKVTIKATGYPDLTFTIEQLYVLMNIPYDAFYENQLNNSVAVDAFTSATLQKSRTKSMTGNAYHTDAKGTEVAGITYAVKLPSGTDLSKYTQVTDDTSVTISTTNRGQTTETTYKGSEALYEQASYAYYKLSEIPASYKEATVTKDGLEFSEIKGTAATDKKALEGVSVSLATTSSYGDYQLTLGGDALSSINSSNIYSVVLTTKEGNDYAMRPLENVWLGTRGLAWTSTNNVKAVHNCATHPDHYKALMGQTITAITYYTSDGTYVINAGNIYVPTKLNDQSTKLKATDANVKSGETSFVESLPSDFKAEYSVAGLKDAKASDGAITFAKDAAPGTYTLTAKDSSGKYADITTTFTVYTQDSPAAYNDNGEAPALVAAEGFSADQLSAYLGNITSVSVDGTEYAASGRGAVKVVKDDGTIDMTTTPFATAKDSYEVTVKSTGYPDVTFTIKTIKSIEGAAVTLSQDSYTYSGEENKPSVTVKNGETALKEGTDYTVAYKDNVNAGTATVTITGTGIYKGTITKQFTIAKQSIEGATVKLSKSTYTYSGKANKPSVTVTSSKALTNKTDYKVAYANNVEPGIATVTITGTGNYTGTITKQFKIAPQTPAAPTISKVQSGIRLTWEAVYGASGYNVYRKTADGEFVRVKTIKSGTTTTLTDKAAVENGQKYQYQILAYTTSGSTNVRSAKSAIKTTYRLDTPVVKATSKVKGKATITWGENAKADFYQVEYSTNSDFSGSTKVIVKGKATKTIANLKAGKKYYVRVRSGMKVGKKGTKYYSAWSTKKAVTIKK